MRVLDPDVREQKRRIGESLIQLGEVLHWIYEDPDKYLPGEEVDVFREFYYTDVRSKLNVLIAMFPHVDDTGQESEGILLNGISPADFEVSLAEEQLTGKVGIGKMRWLSKKFDDFKRCLYEQKIVTRKFLSTLTDYMNFGATFVSSVEGAVLGYTPVSEFLSFVGQLATIRKDRLSNEV